MHFTNHIIFLHITDVTDSRSETFVKLGGTIGGQSWNKFSCNNGLGFRILHSIVAEAFSIRFDVIKRLHRTLIILQDADEVLESVIVDEKKCTEEDGMCVVKLETSLLLPKGFEGEVLIQMRAEDEGVCGEYILKDNGGVNMVSLSKPGIYSEILQVTNLGKKSKRNRMQALLINLFSQTCQWTENAAVDFKYVRTRRDVVSNWKSSICSAVSLKFRVTGVFQIFKI